jgi:D-lactate dehydrogenase (cytochrome)
VDSVFQFGQLRLAPSSVSIFLVSLIMLRQSAAQLRRVASPLIKRGGSRSRTGKAERAFTSGLPKPFWNSGKALLFSAATGTTTYYYGVNDDIPRFQLPWHKTPGPQYASKREMEKVNPRRHTNPHHKY